MEPTSPWSLNRVLALLLTGGFMLLFVDIRHEHGSALNDEAASWIPLVFCVAALFLALPTIVRWKANWRAALTTVYATSILVGVGGLYFHTEGKPGRLFSVLYAQNPAWVGVGQRVAVTSDLIRLADSHKRHNDSDDDDDAPVLAPLAFVGLGLIGLTGTTRRLKSE